MENAQLVSLSRQIALQHQMDVVANNIANINTTGFKASDLMFEDYLMPEARDNDFTGVRFTDNVGWRFGFPLADQRFPDGYVPRVDDED